MAVEKKILGKIPFKRQPIKFSDFNKYHKKHTKRSCVYAIEIFVNLFLGALFEAQKGSHRVLLE